MMKKSKKNSFFLASFFIVFVLLLASCRGDTEMIDYNLTDTSIFSWNNTYMFPENEELVSDSMRLLECKSIYQEVPADTEEEVVVNFLERRAHEGQSVFYLSGAPEWGLENGAKSMISSVDSFQKWNKLAKSGSGFSGIVFDVEPYLTDEWDEDRQSAMEQYVDNCIKTYDYANERSIPIILCIPNFYDSIQLDSELDRLIHYGCDAIAVMNYNKTDELGQISAETAYAKKYGKTIINITELQKPGKHSLKEINTYYNDGLDAVKESWAKIETETNYEKLGFSYHYLKTAIELLELEE